MGKSKIIDRHHACQHCGSSDAASTFIDENGDRFTMCFSCGRTTQLDGSRMTNPTTITLPELSLPADHPFLRRRRLHPESLAAYMAGFSGDELWMPSYVDGFPVFAKVRGRGKKFWSEGTLPHGFGLYGWHSPSTKKHVLIVEGEADAWSAFQMMEGRMTVLSVPTGVNDAAARVKADLDRLEKFERIYVMLDNDPQGAKAQAEILEVLNPGITYPVIGREGFKDASDYLQADQADLFREVVYAAQHVVPKGFVSAEERAMAALAFFQDRQKREGISFGYPSLDAMMGGQRPGEVITWVGGTGSGKSSFMRALLANLYEQQVKTLYVPLEDLPEAVDIMLAQVVLGEDYIHNADADPEALVQTVLDVANYVEVLQAGDLAGAEDLLHKFEYGIRQRDARVIILDHVTWLAESSGDATKTLQTVMPLVKQLAVKHGVTIHLVSHLNRDKSDKDDTDPTLARLKHSAALAQASDAVVGLYGNRDENDLRAKMLKQSRLWGRTDTTQAAFTFTEAGRIIETEWEDRLDDYDDSEDDEYEEAFEGGSTRATEKAPRKESGRKAKRVRDGGVRGEPAPERDDVRAQADSVHDVQPGEQTAGHHPAQRPGGGAEGSADGGGAPEAIVVPPAPTGDHWAAPGYTLPGR